MTDVYVGGRYKFEYERNTKTAPWKCVYIESGWATLQRMSYDHRGNERMSTTSVNIADKHGLHEVKGYVVPTMYISNRGEFYGISFERNENDIGSVEIWVEDNKIREAIVNNFG